MDAVARPKRLPTVVVDRPRCPLCRETLLRKYRSLRDDGGGRAIWWVRCGNTDCNARFKVVLE